MEDPDSYRAALATESDYDSDDEATPPATESNFSDDEVTPPATPTDFAAQVFALPEQYPSSAVGPPKRPSLADHRRLSDLCLSIREAYENRGMNGDIKKACKWLLNRDNVPQRLRTILWEQLLRKGVGDANSGTDEEFGKELADLRRTSADPTMYELCCAAAEYLDADEEENRGRSKRSSDSHGSGQARGRSRTAIVVERKKVEQSEDADESLRSISEEAEERIGELKSKVSSLIEKYEVGMCPGKRAEGNKSQEKSPEDDTKRDSSNDGRLTVLVAEQQAKKVESLLALKRLELEGPAFEPKCTCYAKCHCTFEGKPEVSVPIVADRLKRAGVRPNGNDRSWNAEEPTYKDITDAARLDMGWYDKKPGSKDKMPEDKRDSIRPDDCGNERDGSSSDASRPSITYKSCWTRADGRQSSSQASEWHDAKSWSEPHTRSLMSSIWLLNRQRRTW